MQHSESCFHGWTAQVADRAWLKLTSNRKMFSDLLVSVYQSLIVFSDNT